MTSQHVEEDLSRAYIQAVAARAGVVLSINARSHDYGIDGTFHQVLETNGRQAEAGFALDFQLKASQNAIVEGDVVKYDLDVKTHNYLIRRSQQKNSTPVILILLVLPADADDWLALSEERMTLRKCCYFTALKDPPTANTSTQRIAMPRTSRLTPTTLQMLLSDIEKKDRKYERQQPRRRR